MGGGACVVFGTTALWSKTGLFGTLIGWPSPIRSMWGHDLVKDLIYECLLRCSLRIWSATGVPAGNISWLHPRLSGFNA